MSTAPATRISGITPSPSDEETAAIMAAVEALWPRPMAAPEPTGSADGTSWRFSGRWWASNHIARRGRPGR